MEVTDDEDEHFNEKEDDSEEERLRFMYAAFPADKSTNPRHWESKLSYWIQEITSSSEESFCFSFEKLKERFKRNERYPLGLDVVVDEMMRKGLLCPIEDFTNNLKQSWKEWGIGVVNNSLWRMISLGSPSKDKKITFAVSSLVKNQAEKLIEILRADTANVTVLPWNVAMQKFESACGRRLVSDEFSALVGHLCSIKTIKLGSLDDGARILKFSLRNDSTIADISDVDVAVVRLKQTKAKLSLEITRITTMEESLKNKANVFYHKGDTENAKRAMKEVRKTTQLLSRKNEMLMLLSDNLQSINESKSLEEVTLALQCSAKALKAAYSSPLLSQNNLDTVIDDMQESQSMVEDVEDLLSQAHGNTNQLTKSEEDELQLELKALCLDTENVDVAESNPVQVKDKYQQQEKIVKRLPQDNYKQTIKKSNKVAVLE